MFSLVIRNLIFTILQPGIVAGLVPFLILKKLEQPSNTECNTILELLGLLSFGLGLLLFLGCVYCFIRYGKGTLSPADPTKALVATGVYRYSRNPMYIAILLILFGESMYFQSIILGTYSLIVGLLFHLYIIFVEEKRLRKEFGPHYSVYCQRVKRWI